MLSERKISILTDVVKAYVREAKPIGSQALVGKPNLAVSPATVRSEMLELEDEGFLFQPHTSAGRIPTEKAWRYYLDHVASERTVGKQHQEELRKIVRAYRSSQHELLKQLAQSLAEMAKQAAFVAFGPRDTYYTGLSKLFAHPEFEHIDYVRAVSQVVDHLDEAIPSFYGSAKRDVRVLIGSESPFGETCSIVMTSWTNGQRLIGLLGPVRQDYDANLGFLRFTHDLLTD